MHYVKIPRPVAVAFAASAGELLTREGPVAYAAGDALLTGVAGERWPIRRGDFELSYEPVAPTEAGLAGHYRKRAVVVSARQVTQALTIATHSGSGLLQAQVGDWVVSNAQGQRWVVADAIFRLSYLAKEP